MLDALRLRIASFLKDEGGNATLEFTVLVPPLLYIIFSIGEAGVLMARTVMVDRGLDYAMRSLRLNLINEPTAEARHNAIKDIVCANAYLLNTCADDLLLEITPIPDANYDEIAKVAGEINCRDRTGAVAPSYDVTEVSPSDLYFVRACIIVDPLFPGMGLGAMLPKDNLSGGYAIVVNSAYYGEPE